MSETGYRAALDEAVAEARQQELSSTGYQGDLFAQPGSAASAAALAPVAAGPRGAGRPPGARNKRTDAAAWIYKSRFGDPLSRGVEISALPILAGNGKVLAEFAKVIGAPSRFEAFKAWAGVYASTLPYIHQRLASLTVKPEGSPEGEPITLPWSYAEDEVLEHLELLTDQAPPRDEPA